MNDCLLPFNPDLFTCMWLHLRMLEAHVDAITPLSSHSSTVEIPWSSAFGDTTENRPSRQALAVVATTAPSKPIRTRGSNSMPWRTSPRHPRPNYTRAFLLVKNHFMLLSKSGQSSYFMTTTLVDAVTSDLLIERRSICASSSTVHPHNEQNAASKAIRAYTNSKKQRI